MLLSSPDYRTGHWSRWELKTSTSSTCPQKVWQRHHLVKYLSNPHLKRYMLNGLLWRQCTIQILYWIELEVCWTRKFSVCCFCIWNLENDNLKDLINPKQVLLQSPLFPYKVMLFFSLFFFWFSCLVLSFPFLSLFFLTFIGLLLLHLVLLSLLITLFLTWMTLTSSHCSELGMLCYLVSDVHVAVEGLWMCMWLSLVLKQLLSFLHLFSLSIGVG